jgi:hypothetical protein
MHPVTSDELCWPTVPYRRLRDTDDVHIAATVSAGVENGIRIGAADGHFEDGWVLPGECTPGNLGGWPAASRLASLTSA